MGFGPQQANTTTTTTGRDSAPNGKNDDGENGDVDDGDDDWLRPQWQEQRVQADFGVSRQVKRYRRCENSQ